MSDPLPAPVPDCTQCSEIQQLQGQVRQLQERVRELEARLNTHSGNSSLPPSANPPSAPKPPSKLPTGQRPGGQHGRPPAGITTDLDGNARFVDDLATVEERQRRGADRGYGRLRHLPAMLQRRG